MRCCEVMQHPGCHAGAERVLDPVPSIDTFETTPTRNALTVPFVIGTSIVIVSLTIDKHFRASVVLGLDGL